MEKFNIIVINEAGEQVYPQGVDWDKWKKRLKKGLEWLQIGLDIVVIIISFGGGELVKIYGVQAYIFFLVC